MCLDAGPRCKTNDDMLGARTNHEICISYVNSSSSVVWVDFESHFSEAHSIVRNYLMISFREFVTVLDSYKS